MSETPRPTQADYDHAIRPYSGTAIATLANDASRKQPAAYWRQLVAWVLVESGHRPSEVATILRRKETTVESAHMKVSRLRERDPDVADLTDRLVKRARERAAARRQKAGTASERAERPVAEPDLA